MTANVGLGLVGALVTIIIVFEMLRRRRLREKYAALWIVVAVVAAVVAAAPGTLSWVSELLGIAVPANLLFFGACMLLLIVSMQHSYEIGRLEDRTQTLAEELALLQLEQDKLRDRHRDRDAPRDALGHPADDRAPPED